MPDVASLPVPEAPPLLSTPETRIFEDSSSIPSRESIANPRSDDEIREVYEIERTAVEIKLGQWKRVALQFPDDLLIDAPRISALLSQSLRDKDIGAAADGGDETKEQSSPRETDSRRQLRDQTLRAPPQANERLLILADTSYGACCVDEVAAEHADADAVVHYGRACLSPTTRLPVIYIFTKQPLSQDSVVQAFESIYSQRSERVILMADLPYQHHLPMIAQNLKTLGYSNIFLTSVVVDTQSPLPNRTYPSSTSGDQPLQDWALFHISEPTPSLQLNLASKVHSISFFPTTASGSEITSPQALHANTAISLRRRYGILTSLSAAPLFGILINTLSVRNYMEILNHVKRVIAAAGKKSYTFVVGKVNAAKIANFSEIGGWVVIGCWESSLFEARDFWKPIITPFELELALRSDASRVWTGEWVSDFQKVLDGHQGDTTPSEQISGMRATENLKHTGEPDEDYSEEESAPPDFDLRTGSYVSQSRPMARPRQANESREPSVNESGTATLVRRPRDDMTTVAGQVSPAAAFFRNQRSWQGLGSDFEANANELINSQGSVGATVEQGRQGIARGYRNEQEVSR